jgi:hypothetical protein
MNLVFQAYDERAGYELRSETKPAETTPAWMRFRLTIAPKQTTSLVVEETKPLTNGFRVESVTGNQLDLFVRNQQEDRLEAIKKQAEQLEKEIDAEQARVNDRIAALAFDVRL